MKKFARVIAPVGVIAVGVGIVISLHALKPEPEKKPETERAISAFVEAVRYEPVFLNVQTQGEVQPRVEVDLVSQVSGRVISVSPEFEAGGTVAPNRAILKIDDTDYQHAVTRAKARVAAAKVQVMFANAESSVAKNELVGKHHTPLGLKVPQVEDAKAQLEAAKADLAQARLNLERTTITLPFHGRVIDKFVGVGEFVSAGVSLGTVFSTDLAEVRLPLTDSQLASLELPIGFRATDANGPVVDFSAVVAGKERHWQGQLVRLDATIDPQTRMIHAVAQVKDPYGAAMDEAGGMPFAVGLFVSAKISSKATQTHIIPSAALRSGNQVFVIDNGKLEIRTIKVLQQTKSHVMVSSGLVQGEKVVISPLRAPINGMAIQGIANQPNQKSLQVATAGVPGE